MVYSIETPVYVERNEEVIADLSASIGFTAANISDDEMERVKYVLIQPHGGAIHYRTNGSDATTATGIHVAALSTVEIWGYDAIKNFRCIDDGGTAKLSCKYYGS